MTARRVKAGGSGILTVRTRVPFDLAALESRTGWRDSPRWPVTPSEERAAALAIADRLLGFVQRLDDGDERDAVVLAAPVVLNTVATLGLAALAVERGERSGIVLVGGPPEVSFLSDGAGDGGFESPLVTQALARARWPALRHVARTASWTPAWRLPRALLRPDAVAVTHNSILRAYARNGRRTIRFRQAERALDAAGVPPGVLEVVSGAPGPFVDDAASDLAGRLVGAVLSELPLDDTRTARLTFLLRGRVASSITAARVGLRAVSGWRGLPREIWLGTCGRIPARMIAVAARRRGARITSFDHSGGVFLCDLHAGIILRELAVPDRLVVGTEKLASIGRRALPVHPPTVTREVLSVNGDPVFRRIRAGKSTKTNSGIRRVLYLPKPPLGFRTVVPPLLPDVISLDWHVRLARMLSRLPIELAVRPHPEGILPGLRHPVAREFTPLVDPPFHRVVHMVDALVFDFPDSTAFMEAMCTRRPVVLIDLGMGDLSPETRAAVARRCRIVQTRFDDGNRPQIDEAALADAVCGGPSTVDPTEIRMLLAGDRS